MEKNTSPSNKSSKLLVINVGQPQKASQGFYDKYQPSFPMLLDTAGQISKKFAVKELPIILLIPKGKLYGELLVLLVKTKYK